MPSVKFAASRVTYRSYRLDTRLIIIIVIISIILLQNRVPHQVGVPSPALADPGGRALFLIEAAIPARNILKFELPVTVFETPEEPAWTKKTLISHIPCSLLTKLFYSERVCSDFGRSYSQGWLLLSSWGTRDRAPYFFTKLFAAANLYSHIPPIMWNTPRRGPWLMVHLPQGQIDYQL